MKTIKGVIAATTGKGEVVPDESDIHIYPWYFLLSSGIYAVEFEDSLAPSAAAPSARRITPPFPEDVEFPITIDELDGMLAMIDISEEEPYVAMARQSLRQRLHPGQRPGVLHAEAQIHPKRKCKMKNQMSGLLLLLLAGVAVAVVIIAIGHELDTEMRAVQSGELTLVCVMKDGDRVISPSRVTGFVDGVWLFDNGHARNCEVVKRE